MVRRIKAKLVPGLRDQGLSRNVYCFNVCWAKNLMSKNTGRILVVVATPEV